MKARTQRKLQAKLESIERRISEVENSNPCPEHAPTTYRIIRERLIPLQAEHSRLFIRIIKAGE